MRKSTVFQHFTTLNLIRRVQFNSLNVSALGRWGLAIGSGFRPFGAAKTPEMREWKTGFCKVAIKVGFAARQL
jgi:hypothetical protein